MKKLVAVLIAAVAPLVMLAIPASASTASQALSPSWQTWQHQALAAVGSYRDHGQVSMTSLPSPVSTSSIETSSGPVQVTQQSFTAQDSAGSVGVNVTVLGSQQVVVTSFSPGSSSGPQILVLTPGTSKVANAYTANAAGQTAQTSGARKGRTKVQLVTIGGCSAAAYAPSVIGSIFGPLVDGEGTISCSISETLAAIVSLYVGTTHVGTTAGGTDVGTFLGVNSYDPCVSGGPATFHTAELWSVNGTLQGGGTSGGSYLGCEG